MANEIKVLVVDDSAFMRQYVIGYLEEAGYSKIVEAPNGKIALEVYKKEKPDIVAVELDKKRLYSLFKEKESKIRIYDITRVGIKGFIFSLVGAWAEKKLGKIVGVAPGSEMKKAVMLARKRDIKIALIDQDIEITLKRFSESLTWKEKWNFLADIVKAFFVRKKLYANRIGCNGW